MFLSFLQPQWKEQLAKVSEKAGQSLADPNEYKNLFPDFDKTLAAEKVLGKERQRKMPASMFTSIQENINRRPLDELDENIEDIEVSEDEGEEFSSPVPEHEPEPVEPVKAHISPKPTRKAPPEKEVCFDSFKKILIS